MTGSSAPAAGWYPDPQNPAQLRWFDGTQWTTNVHPGAATPAVAQAPAQMQAQAQAPQQWGGAQAASVDPRFAHDRFVVRQWRRLTVHKYEVHVADGDGPKPGDGALVTYVQQKRMSLKDRIDFHTDKSKTQPLLGLASRRKLDIGGKHDVTDASGNVIGQLNKDLTKSAFVRSTWNVFDAQGNHLALVQEKSALHAVLRRYGGLIPYVGAIFELVPYGFTITAGSAFTGHLPAGAELGEHMRRWGFRDVYDMNLAGDPNRLFDRRIAVALSVALDALQHR